MSSTHSSSSAPSSIHSNKSNKLRLLYAKDGKGYDFASSYTYAPVSSSASSINSNSESTTTTFSIDSLRYAKDGKGHDFSYAYETKMTLEDEEALIRSQQRRTFVNRYAKASRRSDGDYLAIDFVSSYTH